MIRCEKRDTYDASDGMKNYLSGNPGIFIDSAVHDIDLCLSFLGEDIQPKSCYVIGNIAKHKQPETIQDVDNAIGIAEWQPRKVGDTPPISYYYCSRIIPHGFDNPIEVVGSTGVFQIN